MLEFFTVVLSAPSPYHYTDDISRVQFVAELKTFLFMWAYLSENDRLKVFFIYRWTYLAVSLDCRQLLTL